MRANLQDATLELFLLLLKANTMDKQRRGGVGELRGRGDGLLWAACQGFV